MGKISKRTKKFKQKDLPRVLEQRKKFQNIKQQRTRKERAKEDRALKKEEEEKRIGTVKGRPNDEGIPNVENLNVDEFFEGDFFKSDDEDGQAGDEAAETGADGVAEAEDGDEAEIMPDSDDDADIDFGDDDDEELEEGDMEDMGEDKEEEDEEEEQPTSKKGKKASQQGKATKAVGKKRQEASEEEEEDDDDEEKLERDIAAHRETLKKMEQEDPELYADMVKSSKHLLDFNPDEGADMETGDADGEQDGGDMADGDQQAADGAAEEEEAPTKDKGQHPSKELAVDATMERVQFLSQQILEQASVKSLRRMLRLFHYACHLGDSEDAKGQNINKFSLTRDVYGAVMKFSLQHMVSVFDKLLDRTDEQDHKSVKSHAKWPTIEELVKAYAGNLYHFLKQSVDEHMTRYVAQSLKAVMAYLAPFPKIAAKYLKLLLNIWGSAKDQATQIEAFLRIRELALLLPADKGMLEDALKGVYLTYVRNAKFVSSTSLPNILFMANCVVEMYGLDRQSSYQHAFVYIRQLAIHLRNAIISKTKEAYAGVYNWQFVNCLRVWGKVLCQHGANESAELYPLVYPYVQVCLGTASLLPIARYFPLRLQVLHFLNELAAKTHIYIPLSAQLLSILENPELLKKPKPASAKAGDIRFQLKASKTMIPTKTYHNAVISETLRLLLEHFAIYSYSVAFPELCLVVKVALKRFTKKCKNVPVKKQISAFVDRLERNSQWVSTQRSKLDLAPKDLQAKQLSSLATFGTPTFTISSDDAAGADGKTGKKGGNDSTTSPLEQYVRVQMPRVEVADNSSRRRAHEQQEEDDEEEDGGGMYDDDGEGDDDDGGEEVDEDEESAMEKRAQQRHEDMISAGDVDDDGPDLEAILAKFHDGAGNAEDADVLQDMRLEDELSDDDDAKAGKKRRKSKGKDKGKDKEQAKPKPKAAANVGFLDKESGSGKPSAKSRKAKQQKQQQQQSPAAAEAAETDAATAEHGGAAAPAPASAGKKTHKKTHNKARGPKPEQKEAKAAGKVAAPIQPAAAATPAAAANGHTNKPAKKRKAEEANGAPAAKKPKTAPQSDSPHVSKRKQKRKEKRGAAAQQKAQ